jgi:elongation factor G
MDRAGADFGRVVKTMRERLSTNAVPVQLPMGAEAEFRGVVDLVAMEGIVWDAASLGVRTQRTAVPADLLDEAHEARERLVVAASDFDDGLLESWVEGKTLDAPALARAIRHATVSGGFVPVFCGAARRNVGVQALLDGVVDMLPGPFDARGRSGRQSGEAFGVKAQPTSDAPLRALVFKVTSDGEHGLVAWCRVYTGRLVAGGEAVVANRGVLARIPRLMRILADRFEEIGSVEAGDIAAIGGVDGLRTGDTLASTDSPVVLSPIAIPVPVVTVTLTPADGEAERILREALAVIAAEDPSLVLGSDVETGRTTLSGMGELHIEVVLERLHREFGANVRGGRTMVAYRDVLGGTVGINAAAKSPAGRSARVRVELVMADA